MINTNDNITPIAMVGTTAADPYDPGRVHFRARPEGQTPITEEDLPLWMWDFTARCWGYLTEMPEDWSRYTTADRDAAHAVIRLSKGYKDRGVNTDITARRLRRLELLIDIDSGEDYGNPRGLGAYPLLVATFEDWLGFEPGRADEAAWALWSGYAEGAFTPRETEEAK